MLILPSLRKAKQERIYAVKHCKHITYSCFKITEREAGRMDLFEIDSNSDLQLSAKFHSLLKIIHHIRYGNFAELIEVPVFTLKLKTGSADYH